MHPIALASQGYISKYPFKNGCLALQLGRGECKLTGDEQPVSAHPVKWLGIGCMSALQFIYTQTNELA